MDRVLAARDWVVRLIDAYGRLLTAHQQRLLRLYYLDDLSLGEIADRLHVTRQAVFDGLGRAVRELERVEASLGVVRLRDRARKRHDTVEVRLRVLARAVSALDGQVTSRTLRRVTTALAAVRRALG